MLPANRSIEALVWLLEAIGVQFIDRAVGSITSVTTVVAFLAMLVNKPEE
jgi:hypothetical protein